MQRGVSGIVAATVFVLLLVSIVGLGFALDETLKDTMGMSPSNSIGASTSVEAGANQEGAMGGHGNASVEVNVGPWDKNVDANTPRIVPLDQNAITKASKHLDTSSSAASPRTIPSDDSTGDTISVRVRVPRDEVNRVVRSVERVVRNAEEQGERTKSEAQATAETGKEKAIERATESNRATTMGRNTVENPGANAEETKEQVKVSCSGGQCTVEIKVPKEKVEQMNKILEDVMGKEAKRAKTVAVAIPAPVRGEMQSEIEINGVKVRVECHHGACIAEMPAEMARKTVMAEVAKQILERAAPQAAKRLEIKKIETYNLVTDNVTAVMAQDKENNSTVVTYAATGYKTVAITVEIPKDVLQKASGYIEGNVIIVKDDPVLRIYLSPEGNSPSTASFTVKKAVDELGSTVIEFAACQIRVANVQTIPVGDKWQVSFQIRDGNTPVYLQGVHIVGAGVDVVPQYDAATKTYIATVKPAMGLKIRAYVSGCGEITANVPKPAGSQGIPSIVVWGIVLAAIAVLGFGVWLNMKKK